MAITSPLDESYGYGIVLGLGFAFAIVMSAITLIMRRYLAESSTSSETHMVLL